MVFLLSGSIFLRSFNVLGDASEVFYRSSELCEHKYTHFKLQTSLGSLKKSLVRQKILLNWQILLLD